MHDRYSRPFPISKVWLDAVRSNSSPDIEIANESAVIIWDAEIKTEHFIRRTSCRAQAGNFGFVVPTPTKPELADADDYVFTYRKQMTVG
jgi:hypothetical protein